MIYKEKDYSQQKERSSIEMLLLLNAVSKPIKVAIIHCHGQQKLKDLIFLRNSKAYEIAKMVSETASWDKNTLKQNQELLMDIHPDTVLAIKNQFFAYTKEDDAWAEQEQATEGPSPWWTLPDRQTIVPQRMTYGWFQEHHNQTHGKKLKFKNS